MWILSTHSSQTDESQRANGKLEKQYSNFYFHNRRYDESRRANGKLEKLERLFFALFDCDSQAQPIYNIITTGLFYVP